MVISGTTELMKALTALLLITGGYTAYYFIAFSDAGRNRIIKHFGATEKTISLFLFQKLTGFFFLGMLPAVLFFSFFTLYAQPYELGSSQREIPGYAIFVLGVLILATAAFAAKKEDIYNRIPHMRLSRWGPKEVMISFGGWSLYLLAYEFIFRGLLLFSTAAAFGVWPAIAINLLLYAVFHIPNGKKETLAAIPFGLVLCVVSLLTGSFWMAFMLHLVLSISTEMFSIYHNPDMQFELTSKDRRSMKVSGEQKKGLDGLDGLDGLGRNPEPVTRNHEL